MKDIAGVFWFCAEGHTEGGCGGLWGVGGKGSSVRGQGMRLGLCSGVKGL